MFFAHSVGVDGSGRAIPCNHRGDDSREGDPGTALNEIFSTYGQWG
jgi:hypothetical protein